MTLFQEIDRLVKQHKMHTACEHPNCLSIPEDRAWEFAEGLSEIQMYSGHLICPSTIIVGLKQKQPITFRGLQVRLGKRLEVYSLRIDPKIKGIGFKLWSFLQDNSQEI